jgi:uncharacterized protein (TIGR02186 family)
MKRALMATLLLITAPASAEDLVSGISQDTIQITSNYTGTDIVVFGAIERAIAPQGRGIVVIVRGPDEPMTVRRRDRVAGVWVNRDAARFEGLPAYYYLASTEPVARIAPAETLRRYGIGLQALTPSAIGSHHDPEPFRQAAIRYHQRSGLYAENPGSIDFLSETLFRARVPVPAGVTRGQYNVEVYLFRVSFAGELGWEIHSPIEEAAKVWDAVTAFGGGLGLKPFGMYALNSLRVEKGYRAWKGDLSTDYTVLQGGLERFVDWAKPEFRGRAALAAEKQRGVVKRFCTLVIEAGEQDCGFHLGARYRRIPRDGPQAAALERQRRLAVDPFGPRPHGA